MATKPLPLSRAGAQVQVSFEFFPPKTVGDGGEPMGGGHSA